ncbi:MAG TPA: asparagine synthase (glutamine-hydrolyzing) [Pyrinomonadaceae bacterium]|nr:asparagine synthase (glutamine-hydrolyzing) [Pyrinomonadaceae bacterium]
MCGICGIWGVGERASIEAMVAALDHRGPDDRGIYRDERVTLGMTRLSVIDLSTGGSQPMSNAQDTIHLVYNGELYNFQSERQILESKGYSFSSRSDTEVVLHMYEHYGDDFLLRLRGMFALAIYDKRRGPGRERLLLARDHFGIKPLLYTRVAGRLVFASELKALLASGLVEREIDPISLRLLLTFGSVTQPRTMLRGVSMLPPAHFMVVEGDSERVERYWSLETDRHGDLRAQPYDECVAELRRRLEESVRLQMVSDVPVGAFLSGGLDSSLLVALMTKLKNTRVKTFSVGYETEGREVDESGEAARTAEFLGTDHTRVLVRSTDVRDGLSHIVASLDQPSVDGVNSYFVSRAARSAVTVAISGTGSDELFAGYYWFTDMVREESLRKSSAWPAMARSLVAAVARYPALDPFILMRGGSKLLKARNCAGFTTRYATKFTNFNALDAAHLIAPDLRRQAQAGRSPHYDLHAIDELPYGSTVERITGLCLRGYMNNQLLRDLDAVSMAHSLEVRVPFLDPEVADAALSLPESAKIGNGKVINAGQRSYLEAGTKRILMDVARPLLPEGFDQAPKRGFVMPFSAWLRGPLREILEDTLSDERVRSRGLLDVQRVSAVRRGFTSAPAGQLDWMGPWLLIVLELWCREVLEQSATDVKAHF